MLVVPGGFATRALEDDEPTARVDPRDRRDHDVDDVGVHRFDAARARPGLLEGKEATTHWASLDRLDGVRRDPDRSRVSSSRARSSPRPACRRASTWRSRSRRTIAGDEFAQAIQLGIEYDPQPPFDCGSVDKAPPPSSKLTLADLATAPQSTAADSLRATHA